MPVVVLCVCVGSDMHAVPSLDLGFVSGSHHSQKGQTLTASLRETKRHTAMKSEARGRGKQVHAL